MEVESGSPSAVKGRACVWFDKQLTRARWSRRLPLVPPHLVRLLSAAAAAAVTASERAGAINVDDDIPAPSLAEAGTRLRLGSSRPYFTRCSRLVTLAAVHPHHLLCE